MPYKTNVLNYFAYNNNATALHYALSLGAKYQRDKYNLTPL